MHVSHITFSLAFLLIFSSYSNSTCFSNNRLPNEEIHQIVMVVYKFINNSIVSIWSFVTCKTLILTWMYWSNGWDRMTAPPPLDLPLDLILNKCCCSGVFFVYRYHTYHCFAKMIMTITMILFSRTTTSRVWEYLSLQYIVIKIYIYKMSTSKAVL